MIALDTNILARFFIEDPDDLEAMAQREISRKTMLQPCFVPLTVTLEFFWVMKKGYKLDKKDIVIILNTLIGLPLITVEHASHLAITIGLFEKGMDFADAIHLTQSQSCKKIVTFDQKFVKKAEIYQNLLPVKFPQE